MVEEYTTSKLPEFLKQLDSLLVPTTTGQHQLNTGEYMQIALLLKITQLLNEIKQEITYSRKQKLT